MHIAASSSRVPDEDSKVVGDAVAVVAAPSVRVPVSVTRPPEWEMWLSTALMSRKTGGGAPITAGRIATTMKVVKIIFLMEDIVAVAASWRDCINGWRAGRLRVFVGGR